MMHNIITKPLAILNKQFLYFESMRIPKTLLPIVWASSLTLSACHQLSTSGPMLEHNQLYGVHWQVTSFSSASQALTPVLASTKLTANFGTQGRIDGSGGCNHYFASYESSGQNISIASVGATRKACLKPGVMEQESRFLETLAQVKTFRITEKRLELLSASGDILVMFAVSSASNPR